MRTNGRRYNNVFTINVFNPKCTSLGCQSILISKQLFQHLCRRKWNQKFDTPSKEILDWGTNLNQLSEVLGFKCYEIVIHFVHLQYNCRAQDWKSIPLLFMTSKLKHCLNVQKPSSLTDSLLSWQLMKLWNKCLHIWSRFAHLQRSGSVVKFESPDLEWCAFSWNLNDMFNEFAASSCV